MANTIPKTWTGPIALDLTKVAKITETHAVALGNEDHASDIEDAAYYQGLRVALEGVLGLLHGEVEDLTDYCDM